jgi:hypothetical protein
VRCAGAAVAALTRGALFGRIHTGGDTRRTAREYDRTRVGVVTGRIVPAISDGALARALRVLGAAGVAGGVGPPECVTLGRKLKADR